jgi:hypothetical protein
MRLTLSLVLPVLFFALSACGESSDAANGRDPAISITESDTQSRIRITGAGPGRSEPFKIKLSGSYRLYWKAARSTEEAHDPAACPMTAMMESATEGIGYFRNLAREGEESKDHEGMMESMRFRLEAMSYSIKVDTPCEWEFTFERQFTQ